MLANWLATTRRFEAYNASDRRPATADETTATRRHCAAGPQPKETTMDFYPMLPGVADRPWHVFDGRYVKLPPVAPTTCEPMSQDSETTPAAETAQPEETT